MKIRSFDFTVSFLVCMGILLSSSASAQLIEPSRTLDSDTSTKSTLTVLSEPPGLKVALDSKILGSTPVFNAKVEAGTHVLQVGDQQTPLQIVANTPIRIAWFKGSFIELPDQHGPPLTQKSRADEPGSPLRSQTPPPKESTRTNDPFYWPLNPRGPIN